MNRIAVPRNRLLIALIVAAVALRVIVAVALGNSATPVSGAYDQVSYDALAQRLVQGHGFSFSTPSYPFTQANEPTAHWSYLYTLYLAVIYAVAGHSPLIARLVQAVISAAGIWLTYRIGRRLFGETAGLVAAALAASYAYFVFFAAALMTQTFYIIALLAAVDATLDLAERPSWRGWLQLGVALGAGILLRQTLLVFTPILLAWILWRQRWAWRGALVSLAIIGLFVLPWTAFNYATFHDFLLLNSNGGYWMYSSNHPTQGVEFDGTYGAPLEPAMLGLAEPALDRALFKEGLRFIVADPMRIARLSISRIDDYFWLLPSAQSSLLSNLGRMLSFPIYLPFMLYGLYLSFRKWRACVPLYLYVAFDTTLCLLTWASPRYRLPSDALMMVFAGLAVTGLADTLRRLCVKTRKVSSR